MLKGLHKGDTFEISLINKYMNPKCINPKRIDHNDLNAKDLNHKDLNPKHPIRKRLNHKPYTPELFRIIQNLLEFSRIL